MSQDKKDNPTVYIVLGWLSTALSTLFIPIIFGAGGVIFGYLIRNYSEEHKQHGTIMMIAAVAAGIFGTILGMAVDSMMY